MTYCFENTFIIFENQMLWYLVQGCQSVTEKVGHWLSV